ncbi:hypothetical protein LTR53_013530 [Teratosphaeriaceae sp. CCFEE 6253]|nr:hypothetical protein LTR53_013530 [Teratosphaeriaceae sp. CCFEE 6253]
MKLLKTAASLLLCAASASGNALGSRDEGGPAPICLYMTSDYNWKGEGINFCQVGGQCATGLGIHMTRNVSSAGPPEGETCFVYDDVNCTGARSSPIVFPGYANLSDPAIDFDKRAVSWRC